MRTFHSLYFILSKVLRLLILKRDAAVKYFKCNLSFLCASHNAICLYDARVQKLFFWSLVLSQGLRRGTPWTGRQLTQRQTHIHNYGQFTSSLYCERKPEYTENAHQGEHADATQKCPLSQTQHLLTTLTQGWFWFCELKFT